MFVMSGLNLCLEVGKSEVGRWTVSVGRCDFVVRLDLLMFWLLCAFVFSAVLCGEY